MIIFGFLMIMVLTIASFTLFLFILTKRDNILLEKKIKNIELGYFKEKMELNGKINQLSKEDKNLGEEK